MTKKIILSIIFFTWLFFSINQAFSDYTLIKTWFNPKWSICNEMTNRCYFYNISWDSFILYDKYWNQLVSMWSYHWNFFLMEYKQFFIISHKSVSSSWFKVINTQTDIVSSHYWDYMWSPQYSYENSNLYFSVSGTSVKFILNETTWALNSTTDTFTSNTFINRSWYDLDHLSYYQFYTFPSWEEWFFYADNKNLYLKYQNQDIVWFGNSFAFNIKMFKIVTKSDQTYISLATDDYNAYVLYDTYIFTLEYQDDWNYLLKNHNWYFYVTQDDQVVSMKNPTNYSPWHSSKVFAVYDSISDKYYVYIVDWLNDLYTDDVNISSPFTYETTDYYYSQSSWTWSEFTDDWCRIYNYIPTCWSGTYLYLNTTDSSLYCASDTPTITPDCPASCTPYFVLDGYSCAYPSQDPQTQEWTIIDNSVNVNVDNSWIIDTLTNLFSSDNSDDSDLDNLHNSFSWAYSDALGWWTSWFWYGSWSTWSLNIGSWDWTYWVGILWWNGLDTSCDMFNADWSFAYYGNWTYDFSVDLSNIFNVSAYSDKLPYIDDIIYFPNKIIDLITNPLQNTFSILRVFWWVNEWNYCYFWSIQNITFQKYFISGTNLFWDEFNPNWQMTFLDYIVLFIVWLPLLALTLILFIKE